MLLRSYQSAHVARLLSILRDKRAAHDGSFTGSGKTYCAAQIAKELGDETLVIAPLSVCAPWRKIMADAGVNATVTNYEQAVRHAGKVTKWGTGSFFEFTKKWPLVICDEAHRMSGETTLNSKMLISAKRHCGRVLTLSATAASTVLKMKALGFALDLHKLTDYRTWLFARGVREVSFELRSGRKVTKLEISKTRDAEAMAKLHEDIFGPGNRGSRMRLEDIPDFPKTTIELRMMDGMPTAVGRLSDELQLFYRARNMLGTYSQDELAKLVHWRMASETAKIPMLLDMAEDALESSRVAIFVNFNRTVDELLEAAKKRGWTADVVRGDQPASERQRAIEDFQTNKLDLIICNIAAGGVGISLHDPVTKVPRTSLICPSWSATELRQALGRVHRDGGGLSRQFLVYWSTGIESRVANSVSAKLDRLDLLNDGETDESLIGQQSEMAL